MQTNEHAGLEPGEPTSAHGNSRYCGLFRLAIPLAACALLLATSALIAQEARRDGLRWKTSQRHSPGAQTGQLPAVNVGLSRVPSLGFASTFGNVGGAKGEFIRQVKLGSAADRMKLRAGDVILAVNGKPLKTANSWYEAIAHALDRDGWVTLKIRAARSGSIEYRTFNLHQLPVR